MAAYLVGIAVKDDYFQSIPFMTKPDETGGFVTWNTYKRKHLPDDYEQWYKGSLTTNPITWDDQKTTTYDQHKGLTFYDEKLYPNSVKIEIIDGSKEAALILSKNINQYLKASTNYIHIDVGGGSTELSIINKKKAKISRSFPIGSVRLLQGEVNDASWQQMRSWIKDNIKNINVNKAIGSGGNINKIASMLGKKKGKHVEYDQIKEIIKKIKIKNYDQRITQLGLRPDRADVIDYASKIYLKSMKWAGVRKILVPQSGLADGIIEELYDRYKTD